MRKCIHGRTAYLLQVKLCLHGLGLFDVITPSLVTFSIASATICLLSSLAAEIAATLAIWSFPHDFWLILRLLLQQLSVAFFIPFLKRSGLHLLPGSSCLRLHCLCQNGSGCCTITSNIICLVATSFNSCAPMFSNASPSSISFAIVTPSFVMSGAPKGFVENNVSSFRSDRYANGISKFIYTSFKSFSGLNAIFNFLSHVKIPPSIIVIIRSLQGCHSVLR